MIIWGYFMSLGCFLVSAMSPWGVSALSIESVSIPCYYGSIFFQSVFLSLIPVTVGYVIAGSRPTAGWHFAAITTGVLPLALLVNEITMQWIGTPMFSRSLLRISRDLLPSLLPFITKGMVTTALIFGLLSVTLWSISYFATMHLAKRWESDSRQRFKPKTILVGGLLVSALATAIGYQTTADETRNLKWQSTRYPLSVVLSWLAPSDNHHGLEYVDRLRGYALASTITSKEQRFRLNTARVDVVSQHQHQPDVLIIVLESLRSEVMVPRVMPNACRLASRGLTLRSHYSGGNATSLGIFSLVTGLEAIWFYRSEARYAPAMNRLFHQAGYEIGCFSGQNDWPPFQMEGFMNERVYDAFRCEPSDGLRADRLAIHRAEEFLGRPRLPETRPPRLAVVFLYSSHAPFDVDPRHALFEPSADASFMMPFTQAMQPSVWNRYQNAVHSLDAMLDPLLDQSRIILVTGDHGESFLEDGTIGHGTRLSKVQTMTPAVLYVPNRNAMTIDSPTMHADLLPTLLAAAQINVSEPDLFDGLDLHAESRSSQANQTLNDRVFAVANYLGNEIGLVDATDYRKRDPPMAGCAFSMYRWRLAPRSMLDVRGNVKKDKLGNDLPSADIVARWLTTRFGVSGEFLRQTPLELFQDALASDDGVLRLEVLRLTREIESPPRSLVQWIGGLRDDADANVRAEAHAAYRRMR